MYEIFEKLCQDRGVTPYRVCKETGLTTATISNWKAGRYTPKADKLQKIADYFDVSLDYLMTGIEAYRDPAVFNPSHLRASGEEGLQSILADIYERCEDVEIEGKYFSNHYYSIGKGKTRYALYDVEFERLYASIKQIITQMTDVIKRNEKIVRHECQSAADEPPSPEIYAEFRKNGDIIPELEEKYGYAQCSTDQDYLMPQAAHERTDIEITNEMRRHDDDIMADDDFWNK
ncbi:helix-turn-helix domain-containing protein [Clostridium sp. AF18-27]|uniref:helix-turn-helix domain-containing protein n=1 Tax=Enterocloster lavalensis TaxID=460384 RepID=UPI000E4A272A|nr:helix-turn-helix transcriptional regulator [Enterocloster lavalensis]RHR52082.1 helix-turn-helix domain-containing protein [Clostridium sp. AF18-27]